MHFGEFPCFRSPLNKWSRTRLKLACVVENMFSIRPKSIGKRASSGRIAPMISLRWRARSAGREYFANVPSTFRQGVEAEASFHYGNLSAYVNYAFVDATYQFAAVLSSPNNPFANGDGRCFVTPGDDFPAFPAIR